MFRDCDNLSKVTFRLRYRSADRTLAPEDDRERDDSRCQQASHIDRLGSSVVLGER